MAITGSGISAQDPYMVHTYDELVSAASESGKFIKLANDINITDEYPDGDMPQLVINNSVIDGNNKKIANWYKTTSGYAISVSGGSSQLYNCTVANIYSTTTSDFIQINNYNSNYHFVNVNFYGVLWGMFFMAVDTYGSTHNFKSCAFNIKSNKDRFNIFASQYSYIGMKDCNIKANSTSADNLFGSTRQTFVEDCYIESDVPCGSWSKIKNSVIDITSNASFSASGSSSNALCTVNSTHAPNATAGNGFALVDDAHWLDVAYLNSIGFNAG